MYFSRTIKPHTPNQYYKRSNINSDQYSLLDRGDLRRKILRVHRRLCRPPGIHSNIAIRSAGFQYTHNGDAARCDTCKLEVSGWTSNMIPFTIHSQRSPTCPFVLSMLPSQKFITPTTSRLPPISVASTDGEKPFKRLKTEADTRNPLFDVLVEVDILKQTRKRTFSHWPHRSSPSSSQMIEAGFFGCNVGDRVICIYCNITCQQWTPNSDDPCEVHKTLSSKCLYVITILTRAPTLSISFTNEGSTAIDPYRSHTIIHIAACNSNYIEIPKRYASFATWANENSPSADDLVRAGFFYTGTKTIVTCFYCNGSLQNWGSNDNPMTKHARWFPNCAYAKQLCGTELYRKIQESKRAKQKRTRSNDSSNRSRVGADNLSGRRLFIPDESTLSRFVAARLDLPITQRLLDKNFKLSIIKRCWEDQLRLKHDDFVSDNDLFMACTILQKQIEHIDGKKENIVVPSVAMKRVREEALVSSRTRSPTNIEVCARNEAAAASSSSLSSSLINASHSNGTEMATTTSARGLVQNYTINALDREPCRLCPVAEWHSARLPCVHVCPSILRRHSF